MQVNAQAARRSGGLEYKWIVAIVGVIGAFMAVLDTTIVNIAIPRLQTAFGADLNSVQWVLTGYILVQGVVTPTTAFFANRLGTKRFYILSLSIFTIGSALCGLAWNLPMLIFFRVLQGIGGAFLFPLVLTLLYQEFPPQERGFASGIFGIPVLLAPALGPTVGGYIVTYAGWQLIFYINVPIGIMGVILAAILLREARLEAQQRFDAVGFVFVALGLIGVLYGLSSASTDGWSSTTVVGTLVGGTLCLIVFVVAEIMIANRGGQPLVDLRLFANVPFTTSNIAIAFVSFALYGGLFLFPIYLQDLRSLSAYQTGLLLLPQAFASMLAVLVGGRLVDRIGVRAVVIPGLLLLAFANWELSFLTIYTPYGSIQWLFVARGLGLGLCNQPLLVSALSEMRPRQLAQASSLSTVVRFVISSLSIAILATLVQTQSSVHYTHLAEQVTATSPLGQLLPQLQAYFMTHGADMNAAKAAALQVINGLVQQQSFDLAIQDAFRITAAISVVSIFVTLFVRNRRTTARAPQQAAGTQGSAQAEEEQETREMVFAE